jgi:glycosyltransferase involved in cell wall biosynthesis
MASKMAKLISVCIPTYGRSAYLQAAVRSVLEQDHRPLEILVGDDSPNAQNRAFIASLPHDEGVSVRYVPNETRLGQASNVNRLLMESRGDWIVILHDDDFLLPGALTSLFQATGRYPDAIAAFGLQAVVDHDGVSDWEASAASNRDFGRIAEAAGPQTSRLASAVSGQFPNNGFLLKGDIARQVLYNGYDDVKDACDYDFGIRVALAPVAGTFVLIEDYVSAYRVWGAQISKASSTGIAALRLLKALKPQTSEEAAAIRRAIVRHVPIALSEHARVRERMSSLKLLLSPSYWESSRLSQVLYHIMLIVSPGMVRMLKTRLRS